MDGVAVFVGLPADAGGDMFAKRSLTFDAGGGTTGLGATNGVEEVMVEPAGGEDIGPENPDRGASVVRPGVVADWKSSKSSSLPIPDSRAPNSCAALGEVIVALPFDVDVAAGSSPKSKRSCSGSFTILASLLIVLSEAARSPEEARARAAEDFAAGEPPSSSASSYSSNLSLRCCLS